MLYNFLLLKEVNITTSMLLERTLYWCKWAFEIEGFSLRECWSIFPSQSAGERRVCFVLSASLFFSASIFGQNLKPELCAAASCPFRLWHMLCSDSLFLQKGWLSGRQPRQEGWVPRQHSSDFRTDWWIWPPNSHIISFTFCQASSAISRFMVEAKFFHFGVWNRSLHFIFSLTPAIGGSLTQSRLMIDTSRERMVSSWIPSPVLQERLFHRKHFQSQNLKGTGWTGKALPSCWVSGLNYGSVTLHLLR